MKSNVLKLIFKLLGYRYSKSLSKIIDKVYSIRQDTKYVQDSYSQEGEDLILSRFFGERDNGFFVDIGAHHPKRFSNTYIFYLKGWRGINIDALSGSKNIFDIERPEDINLEVGVNEIEGDLNYYSFNEPALNTFDKSEADNYLNGGVYSLIEVKRLETKTLSSILDIYVNVNQEIDFISVDVEGLDLNVLKSNDWLKYKPKIVLVEILHFDFKSFSKNQVVLFMESVGYAFYAKTVNTVFFQRIDI
jgi:hypothetical protein